MASAAGPLTEGALQSRNEAKTTTLSSEGDKMYVETTTYFKTVTIKKELEEEINAKLISNMFIKEEIEEPKTEADQKMEVDLETCSAAVDETKHINPKKEGLDRIKLEQKDDGSTHLTIEGAEEDDDEEEVLMNKEEVHKYLVERIAIHLKDPELCRPLRLRQRSQELQEEAREKYEEYHKMTKLCDLLYHNQLKFFRHMGLLPKIQTRTVGISVHLPCSLSDMPNHIQENLKRGSSSQNVMTAFTTNSLSSSPTTSSSFPIKPSLISAKPSPIATNQTPIATKSSAIPPKLSFTPSSQDTKSVEVGKSDGKSKQIEFIDLTDDPEPPKKAAATAFATRMIKHPAPLPPKPFTLPNKSLPSTAPKPKLSVSAEDKGIVLQWDMPINSAPPANYDELKTFDIFGYQEQLNVPINTLLWKKIGTVKAMVLPMACTLTQFVEGNTYHFSVRAVDVHNRCGAYSDPISVVYTLKKSSDKKGDNKRQKQK